MARMTKAQLESQVVTLSTTLQVRERELAELRAELHQLRTSGSSVSEGQKSVNPNSKLDPKYIEYSKARAQAFKLKAWFDKQYHPNRGRVIGSKAVYRADDGKDYAIADLKEQFEQAINTPFTAAV
jgi:hypothetical protein